MDDAVLITYYCVTHEWDIRKKYKEKEAYMSWVLREIRQIDKKKLVAAYSYLVMQPSFSEFLDNVL